MTRRRGIVTGVLASALVAACGSGSSPSISVIPSSASPTAGPGSGSPASPDPGRGELLAAAFLERVHDPDARYRLDQSLTVVIGQASSKAVSHSDIAGADMLVVSDSTVGGTTTHLEYLQADGAAYERSGGEDWRAVGPADAQQGLYPFIKVGDLKYAGHEIKGGEFLDSLSLATSIPIGSSVAESFGVKGGLASVIVLDCFLHDDGIPVRVEMGFRLDAADGTAAGYGTIIQDYTEFGGDIAVDPPIT